MGAPTPAVIVDPTTPINRAGQVTGTGSAQETASASGNNAYSGVTATAPAHSGGQGNIYATTRVYETWKWDTLVPNEQAPPARTTGTYTYDGSVYASYVPATNSSASAWASFAIWGYAQHVFDAIANQQETSVGPATDNSFSDYFQGSTTPFNVNVYVAITSDAKANALSPANNSGASAHSGTNHIGVTNINVTPRP